MNMDVQSREPSPSSYGNVYEIELAKPNYVEVSYPSPVPYVEQPLLIAAITADEAIRLTRHMNREVISVKRVLEGVQW